MRGLAARGLLAAGLAIVGSLATAFVVFQDSPEEKAYAAEEPRHDQLLEIAAKIYAPKANMAELFTEAVKLSGVSIWTEGQKVIAEPTGSPALGLAITDDEIKWFSKMQESGNYVTYGSIIDALDYIYREFGAEGSCAKDVRSMLRQSYLHKNPSSRALVSFIKALNDLNPDKTEAPFATPESHVSAFELLLILRLVTEEMTFPIREWMAKDGGSLLRASIDPVQALPGGAWSTAVSIAPPSFSELRRIVVERATQIAQSDRAQFLKDTAGKIMAAVNLLKMIKAYATLKCDFSVETPGQPLIRTTTTSPGEVRTVKAHWYVDFPQLKDWMTAHQHLLAGNVPPIVNNTPLANVETDWQFVRGSNSPGNQLVQVHVDMSKVLTDSNGDARVEFEGKPQPRNMNRNAVAPVDKELQLQVTPQQKSSHIGSDLWDALWGAMGAVKGGTGFIKPLTEMIYRLKWFGTKGYKLTVRDWVPGETRGTVTFKIHGYGSTTYPGSRSWQSIDRYLEYKNVLMEDLGAPPPPPLNLDPMTPAYVRKQAEDMYNQMLEAAKMRIYISAGPGSGFMSIQDAMGGDGLAGECGPPSEYSGQETTSGRKSEVYSRSDIMNGDPSKIGFAVTVDLKKMTAIVQASGTLNVTSTATSTLSSAVITGTRNFDKNVLDVLENGGSGLEVVLTQAQGVGSKQIVYKGRKEIQFLFGPKDRYRGRCQVEFELIRVPKKTP